MPNNLTLKYSGQTQSLCRTVSNTTEARKSKLQFSYHILFVKLTANYQKTVKNYLYYRT